MEFIKSFFERLEVNLSTGICLLLSISISKRVDFSSFLNADMLYNLLLLLLFSIVSAINILYIKNLKNLKEDKKFYLEYILMSANFWMIVLNLINLNLFGIGYALIFIGNYLKIKDIKAN